MTFEGPFSPRLFCDSVVFLLGRSQFVFFLTKGGARPQELHPLSPFGFWAVIDATGILGPFLSLSICISGGGHQLSHVFSRTPEQVPLAGACNYKEKGFYQVAPASETSGSCSPCGCLCAPFHVQAVGYQPLFGGRRRRWLGRKETWNFVPTLAPWCSPSCLLRAPSTLMCALL